MDFTPSSQRGRWNTLWSLVRMSPLSISASIAGKIADTHGYRFMFQVTAAIYALGALVYSPLLALVPRREGAPKKEAKATALEEGKAATATKGSDLVDQVEAETSPEVIGISSMVLIGLA